MMNGGNYEKLYFGLYSELADIIENLQNIQKKYEKMYIEIDTSDEKTN